MKNMPVTKENIEPEKKRKWENTKETKKITQTSCFKRENFPCKDSLLVTRFMKKFKMHSKIKLIAHDLVIYFLNYLYCFNYKIYKYIYIWK